jgi:transcriptional regulator with XRE-family HTH domain
MQTTEEILVIIGKNIRKLRKSKNWSQADLALIVGMHKSYIGAIEKGRRNISLIKIARFAKVFEIKIDELIVVGNK